MPAVSQPKQIDALMEEASQALADTAYFASERLSVRALVASRQACDFERMIRILLPLQEARRQRYQMALDVGAITIMDTPVPDDVTVETGCYLFRPNLVGADGRRFRLAALEQEVPVAVVCREPLTQIRLCPVVAIGPGVTVRERIDPPEDPDDPSLAWFTGALEQLGDFAIESLDPGRATLKRLDALLGRLDAIPEHEGLHQAVAETCRQAVQENVTDDGPPKRRRPRSK